MQKFWVSHKKSILRMKFKQTNYFLAQKYYLQGSVGEQLLSSTDWSHGELWRFEWSSAMVTTGRRTFEIS